MECQNHLKQLALGALHHEAATGRYPTGGWTWEWIGEPERGTDHRQPGGWIYNILPYIEQQAIHDLPLGKSGSALLDATTQIIQTPLAILMCPTRREPKVYPLGPPYPTQTFHNTNTVDKTIRNDYAANGGDTYGIWSGPSGDPATLRRATSRQRLHPCYSSAPRPRASYSPAAKSRRRRSATAPPTRTSSARRACRPISTPFMAVAAMAAPSSASNSTRPVGRMPLLHLFRIRPG